MFLNIQPLNPKTCNASLMLLIVNDKYLKIKSTNTFTAIPMINVFFFNMALRPPSLIILIYIYAYEIINDYNTNHNKQILRAAPHIKY